MQVSILIKCAANILHVGRANTDLFIRLKALESHKLLKLEMPVAMFTQDPQWQKLWILQCEARTKGVVLELRYQVEGCLRSLQKSKRVGGARLTWNDLQKTPMLFHEILFSLPEKRFSLDSHRHPHQLRLGISITPAVQVRIIWWLCHVIRCVSNAIEFSVLRNYAPWNSSLQEMKNTVVQIQKAVYTTKVVVVFNHQNQPRLWFFSFTLVVCISLWLWLWWMVRLGFYITS